MKLGLNLFCEQYEPEIIKIRKADCNKDKKVIDDLLFELDMFHKRKGKVSIKRFLIMLFGSDEQKDMMKFITDLNEVKEPIDLIYIKNMIDEKTNTTLVAEIDKEVVGFMLCREIDDEFHLSEIVTDKEYRGKGVASALIGMAISVAKSKGYKHITLRVFDFNNTARKLYTKFGFKPVKDDSITTTMELRIK